VRSVLVGVVPIRLDADVGGLVLTLFQRIAKRVAHTVPKPAVQGTDQLLHGIASGI